MRIMKLLAMALGLIVAAMGVLGVAAPSVLLEFGRSLQTTTALYIVAAMRVMFGAILLWIAPHSRAPKTLRVVGAVIIIAGAFTLLFGVERSRGMFDWWTTQGPTATRAWAVVAVLFGLFIVHAVTSPRRSVP